MIIDFQAKNSSPLFFFQRQKILRYIGKFVLLNVNKQNNMAKRVRQKNENYPTEKTERGKTDDISYSLVAHLAILNIYASATFN
jgi:hypothetical protein